jgi:hypothetical protein
MVCDTQTIFITLSEAVTMVCDTQTIFITLSEARRLEVLYVQVKSKIPSRRHEHYSQMGIISTFILSSIPCTFFSSTWNDPSLLKKTSPWFVTHKPFLSLSAKQEG